MNILQYTCVSGKSTGSVLQPWLRSGDSGKVMTEFSQIFTHSHF
jgi:hypothetical protein